MILFIILGVIVLFAISVIGFLYYWLQKEAGVDAPPITASGSNKSPSAFTQRKTDKPVEVPVSSSAVVVKESERLDQITKEYEHKEILYQKKVRDLEDELNAISKKAQNQSQEALNTIEQLKAENEQLKNARVTPVVVDNTPLIKAQENIVFLKQEQDVLQTRLVDSQEQAKKLQEEVVAIKQQMAQEIVAVKTETAKLVMENQRLQSSLEASSANIIKPLQDENQVLKQDNETFKKTNQELLTEKAMLQSSIEAAVINATENLRKEIQNLKQENESLRAGYEDRINTLTQDIEKLKSVSSGVSQEEIAGLKQDNQTLKVDHEQEKERSENLQWELTKARAQVTSFERACENYQHQLKDALDRLEVLQKTTQAPS
ncbi:MAG: hypothetical protein HQL15_09745 [Candidatus Omnitrophica bacterium]|nr:hypothetical protein [Candidatus Omnitrophota bacterium]